jgi:hypothetical protein
MKYDEMHPVPPDMDEPPVVTPRTASAVLGVMVAQDPSTMPPTDPPTPTPHPAITPWPPTDEPN